MPFQTAAVSCRATRRDLFASNLLVVWLDLFCFSSGYATLLLAEHNNKTLNKAIESDIVSGKLLSLHCIWRPRFMLSLQRVSLSVRDKALRKGTLQLAFCRAKLPGCTSVDLLVAGTGRSHMLHNGC